jgi:hypothetical protein
MLLPLVVAADKQHDIDEGSKEDPEPPMPRRHIHIVVTNLVIVLSIND